MTIEWQTKHYDGCTKKLVYINGKKIDTIPYFLQLYFKHNKVESGKLRNIPEYFINR